MSFLPWGVRGSIRIVDFHYGTQEQSNTLANGHKVSAETREAYIPRGFRVRGFVRAPPREVTLHDEYKQVGRHAGHFESHRAAPLLRFGSRRTKVDLLANTGLNADHFLSDDAGDNDEQEKVQGAIAALEAKLITARGRLIEAESDLKDAGENGFLLLAADFERYKRKAEAEMSSQKEHGKMETLRGLLAFFEGLDFLQRGEGSSEAAAIDSFYAGFHSDVQRLLRRWKVTPLAVAAGNKFDHTLHQAVGEVVSEEVPAGLIIEVREQGWKVEDKILREASVVVSSGPPKPPPADEETRDQAAEATRESAANIQNNASVASKACQAGDPQMASETSEWTRRLRQDGGRSRWWQMRIWRSRPLVASESQHTEESVDEITRDPDGLEAVATLPSLMSVLTAKLKVFENELLKVEEQIETAKASAEEESKKWTEQRTRLQSDVDNYKRRHIERKQEAQLDARIEVLKEFLSVLDNFDRARAAVSLDGEAQETRNAMYEHMYVDLMAALGELGLEKIETVGSEFDYNSHNVIQQVPSDEYDSGVVVSEMQAGYTCKGRLVREACVAVAL